MKLNPAGVEGAMACSFANWLLAILCACFLLIVPASTAVESQTGANELTPTKQWVVAQLTAGEVADLTTQKDRKLSAHFLQESLVGAQPGFKPHRNGVRIKGAIIDEPVDLKNAQIPCDVWLRQCQFNKSVILAQAKVKGDASFLGSVFQG